MASTLPALPARLTQAQADDVLAGCVAALERGNLAGGEVVLDAGGLQAFDSSVLALMLGVRRAVLARGGTLRVRQMPQRLRDLAGLYGVSELLPG
jgi:phospholipid transport system transporter-binding protein